MAYYFKINVYLPRLQNNVAYGVPGRDGKDYNKHVRSTVWVQTIATTFLKKMQMAQTRRLMLGCMRAEARSGCGLGDRLQLSGLYGAKMDAYRNG